MHIVLSSGGSGKRRRNLYKEVKVGIKKKNRKYFYD